MTDQRAAVAHIADCITHNRPIDRSLLAELLGMDGKRLESFINQAVCAFCLVSQGRTGTWGLRNAPRQGRLKRNERCAT